MAMRHSDGGPIDQHDIIMTAEYTGGDNEESSSSYDLDDEQSDAVESDSSDQSKSVRFRGNRVSFNDHDEEYVPRRNSNSSAESSVDGVDGMMTRSHSNLRVSAAFIKSEASVLSSSEPTERCDERVRDQLRVLMKSTPFDVGLGCVVIFDVILTYVDINVRAAGGSVDTWIEYAGYACLAFYAIEFATVVYVRQRDVLQDQWMAMDAIILLSGLVELVLASQGITVESVGILRILRIVRIMRLLRLFRKFVMLKELRKLLMMMGSCFKTLLWSFLFCFIVMTTWAMASVELVYPVVQELDWHDCEACTKAFSTVMHANLTLFKTIIAGDSWGQVAVPVIEKEPMTAIIFCGAHLTVVFGVLNLVVAVVVDTFAEQRQKDVMTMAQDMDADDERDMKHLTKMFEKIDFDQNGEVTLEELMSGARAVPEFQSRLRVMDIDEADLENLFHMLDEDNGGTISPSEFNSALSRWLHESKTATRFVKYDLQRARSEQAELRRVVMKMNKRLGQMNEALKTSTQNSNSGGDAKTQMRKRRMTPWPEEAKNSLEAFMAGHVQSEGSNEGVLGSSLDEVHLEPSPKVTSLEELEKSLDASALKDILEAATKEAHDALADSLEQANQQLQQAWMEATRLALQESFERAEELIESLPSNEPINQTPGCVSLTKPEFRPGARPLGDFQPPKYTSQRPPQPGEG